MLINLRNALIAGKRLPYDAEVEFLESTGTEYIITDYVPNDSSVAELDFQSVGDSPSLMGVYSASSRFNLGISTGNKNWFGGIGAGNTNSTTALADSSWRKLILDAPQKTLTVSGVGSYPCGSGSVGGNTAKFNLFARHSNGDGKNLYPARLYGVKFSEGGVLVRDYIPVRKGTVGYLYDRVSGALFGNAGTGDFVLGQDVVPVEYIESHGTEYINTGIILNDTYGIDINFAPMETASGVSEHGIFGSSVSGSGIRHNVLQIHSSAGGVGLWMPSNTRICNYAITIGEYQHWQINLNDSDEVVIDNVLKAHTHPTTPAECQYPVYLFGRNVANTLKSGSCSKMRLATWIVCDGSGNFIQKGLPVRVGTGSTWEGAMMDVLTRRIYRNAGTGAFTYGNDLKYPIPAE